MPRRSRRSPRHLRVSGQRRRRYRDERYPTQSPMPLTIACASPEMASGKVWIRYPVPRAQEEQAKEIAAEENVAVEQEVAPMVDEAALVSAVETEVVEQQPAAEAEVVAPAAETEVTEPVVVEPQQTVAEPETVEVETTHPEVIAAPVDAAPQLIAEEDVVVAEEVAEEAEPVAAVEDTAEAIVETTTEEIVQDVEIHRTRLRRTESPKVKPVPSLRPPSPVKWRQHR